jgi:competence protein ComEC
MAGGAWLSALTVLHLGWSGGVALAGLAGAAAAGLGWWLRPGSAWRSPARRRGRRAVGAELSAVSGVALGLLLGVVCGAAATVARVSARDAAPVAALARGHATVRAELDVRDDPRPVRGVAGRPRTYAIGADLTRLTAADNGHSWRVGVRVLVLASDAAWVSLLPGQSVTATGRLSPPRGGDLRAAVLSVSGAPEAVRIAPWYQRAAGALRAGLQRACAPLPDAPGGLLPGLVVGDTSALDPELADDFRATGMTHLVAVSGSNVAVIIGAVLLLARWGRAGPRPAAALSLLSLVGFVILARPSPSVLRAGVMGGIGLLALASARRRAAVPALCAAVTLLVLVDPELSGDPGFALSVLATGGLLLLAPGWRDRLRARGVPPGLAEALAVPAAAQFACLPVVAAISGAVSLVALPANLLAVPAVAPATILGVVAAVLSPVWPGGATAAAWLAQWPARWLVTVAGVGADIPSGALPWPPGAAGGLVLAAVLVGVLLAARHRIARRLTVVVALAGVLGALPVRLLAPGWPPAGWVVAACAVGQGDALVLPTAPGRAVMIDTGPDPGRADRCLRDLGVDSVSLLVITHFHADHAGGVEGVFRGRDVAAVVGPAWPEPAAGRAQVDRAAGARGGRLGQIEAGWWYAEGAVRLSVLGPPRPIAGTRSDPNNNSLVLGAVSAGVSIVLAGDAEGEEQAAMLETLGAARLRCDVLKVAHHGSAFQDPAFLDATHPRVALVSVGVGNGYGHPNGAVLDRLSRSGARVLRTDLAGDVAVMTVDGGLTVAVRAG